MPNPGLAFLFPVFGSLDAQGTNKSRLAKRILLPKVSKTSPRASEMSKHNWKCGEIFIRRRVNECFIQKVTGSFEFLIKSCGAIRSRLSSAFSCCALRKSTTTELCLRMSALGVVAIYEETVFGPKTNFERLLTSKEHLASEGSWKSKTFAVLISCNDGKSISAIVLVDVSPQPQRILGGKSIIYLLFKLILSPKKFARLKLKALARR